MCYRGLLDLHEVGQRVSEQLQLGHGGQLCHVQIGAHQLGALEAQARVGVHETGEQCRASDGQRGRRALCVLQARVQLVGRDETDAPRGGEYTQQCAQVAEGQAGAGGGVGCRVRVQRSLQS